MEDDDIIDLFWERSETAIEETSKKYGNYCRSIIRNILKNNQDVEECLNDTYLKLWAAIPPGRPNILLAYVGKIARNQALDRYKENTRKKRGGGEIPLLLSELEECIPASDNIENEYMEGVTVDLINEFLYASEKLERMIFVRRYWYADSIKEIAKRYKMSTSKIKSILFRSRKKLKEYLEGEGIFL